MVGNQLILYSSWRRQCGLESLFEIEIICDGSFYVLTWLGQGTQIFD